jgi:S1-C subfamily serine protease
VIVVGSPLGLGGTVATGIVSAFRTEEGLEYLQFSAPVSPGNSGGPVVDRSGAVVGVAVGKVVEDGAEGLSFAIPYERACRALGLCNTTKDGSK